MFWVTVEPAPYVDKKDNFYGTENTIHNFIGFHTGAESFLPDSTKSYKLHLETCVWPRTPRELKGMSTDPN